MCIRDSFFSEALDKISADWEASGVPEYGPVECFAVDLDLPPLERWAEVIGAYKTKMAPAAVYLREMLKMMETQLAESGAAVPQGFSVHLAAQQLCAAGHMDLAELQSVASLSGFSAEDLGLLQLAYEASARCSCVVANTPDGAPLHARTLDWGALFLRDLAVNIEFQRAGQTVFSAATWAGYLGVLTGCAPGRFAASVNYRSLQGSLVQNFSSGLQGGWPVGFLVRHVLQDPARYPDYDSARAMLSSAPLMSPCYLVVTGCVAGQGSSITRNREGEEQDKAQQLRTAPIVMTNVDLLSRQQHRDTKESSPRRVCAVFYLKAHGDLFADADSAWQLLSTPPLNNTITLYVPCCLAHSTPHLWRQGCVMCPATGQCDTRVHINNPMLL
eukprot:TRINITY_DN18650_c0_g1_i2.p1 TRINITY_DN18650_c0_g1~~TRINITY_DN18650_c0_g1_i2.p1  ORF type:complete len:387 (+),score=85.45 TRINITY_DN18650_c0_g1_i2:91-1251(+)